MSRSRLMGYWVTTLGERDARAEGGYVALAVYAIRFGLVFRGGPLIWNRWVRQVHRWLSMAFTVAVIVNIVALAQGEPAAWVVYSPLFPLALLLLTGLYLFVLPYATRWRGGRRTGE